MGKKSYNWKSRQIVNPIIDNTETNKIKLDFPVDGTYDQSNQLVLPSKKRKTKIKNDKTKVTRLLSKKQRKKLEKVVEKKRKKEGRAELLEKLSQVQATPAELSQYASIASIQTIGLKKYFSEQISKKEKVQKNRNESDVKLNSLVGSKRQRIALSTSINNGSNVIGFESSGSDEDTDDSCVSDKKAKVDDVTVIESKVIIDEVKPVVVNSVDRKPAVFVPVHRKSVIQKARLKLPILAEEQEIMELISQNSVVIIAGETGSGKTTQVPQFLYEAGYAINKMIGVTEPRRVAAISMSQRVAEEMNVSNEIVSYLIRFEGNVTDNTKIKFMTDGVLLREVQNDFLLTKYSVIILDEAHERSVYTDILIGLLSRIVPLRNKRGNPLKLIIMSATLRLEDFTENLRLFKTPPPVLKVEARQFPVTIHFNKHTFDNYLKEAYNKTVKIHTKLPDGGILVFVTGQQEVKTLVQKLRKSFKLRRNVAKTQEHNSDSDEASEIEQDLKRTLKRKKIRKVMTPVNLDDYSIPGDNDVETESELNSEDEIGEIVINTSKPLWVLPLYSLLPSYEQAKVFREPPEGTRLCVVSTNVAETSLTIPNIKYVVDSGKTKVKLYDKVTGVTSYMVTWTSKASANQRAGRAGRVAPGHCYRLYSSAVFNDTFQEFSVPEIQQKPVDDLYLQMKCMNVDKVHNFPFPTAPDLMQLKTAESRLEVLGALKNSKVTSLGRAISKFPVLPRYGKMLALSHQQNLLPYTICIVAALSVQEVLLETPITQSPEEAKNLRQKWGAMRRQWAGVGNSLLLGDPMVLLRAVGAAEYANTDGKLETFCLENGLRHKAIIEIRKLRVQLTNEIKMNVPDSDIIVDPKLAPPSDLQSKLLRQIILAGMGDQVAKKIKQEELKESEDKIKLKYAYRANNLEEPVFLHQGSVLKKTLPEFVVYQEIYETNKMYMRGVTAIEPEWLATYVPNACHLSDPLIEAEPRYDSNNGKIYCTVSGTFGPQAWPLLNVEIEFPKVLAAYKWFGRFLLEGKVCKKLEKYTGSLLNSPSAMIKTWARLQPRTGNLLRALLENEVLSKHSLIEAFRTNPKYLLKEYLSWLPESAHADATMIWPPLD
ncbi:hypothetical protein RN001_010595 [Aquatica leii]|uniref:RNA helicase n=1 Tax=Aquatica leii TaxID=1421715 RepID=A0AAN7PV14_9COLE|nr:hypothetical protein RN001_010595 [Aquatica leii]